MHYYKCMTIEILDFESGLYDSLNWKRERKITKFHFQVFSCELNMDCKSISASLAHSINDLKMIDSRINVVYWFKNLNAHKSIQF